MPIRCCDYASISVTNEKWLSLFFSIRKLPLEKLNLRDRFRAKCKKKCAHFIGKNWWTFGISLASLDFLKTVFRPHRNFSTWKKRFSCKAPSSEQHNEYGMDYVDWKFQFGIHCICLHLIDRFLSFQVFACICLVKQKNVRIQNHWPKWNSFISIIKTVNYRRA